MNEKIKQIEIVGYSKFKSKEGVEYCKIYVKKLFNENQLKKGCCGAKTDSLFVPAKCIDMFQQDCIGKEIKIAYDVDEGRISVIDIKII